VLHVCCWPHLRPLLASMRCMEASTHSPSAVVALHTVTWESLFRCATHPGACSCRQPPVRVHAECVLMGAVASCARCCINWQQKDLGTIHWWLAGVGVCVCLAQGHVCCANVANPCCMRTLRGDRVAARTLEVVLCAKVPSVLPASFAAMSATHQQRPQPHQPSHAASTGQCLREVCLVGGTD
jgi:hypothetical protein